MIFLDFNDLRLFVAGAGLVYTSKYSIRILQNTKGTIEQSENNQSTRLIIRYFKNNHRYKVQAGWTSQQHQN